MYNGGVGFYDLVWYLYTHNSSNGLSFRVWHPHRRGSMFRKDWHHCSGLEKKGKNVILTRKYDTQFARRLLLGNISSFKILLVSIFLPIMIEACNNFFWEQCVLYNHSAITRSHYIASHCNNFLKRWTDSCRVFYAFWEVSHAFSRYIGIMINASLSLPYPYVVTCYHYAIFALFFAMRGT